MPDSELLLTGRYARMRNIKLLPSARRVERWMMEAGFNAVRAVSIARTTRCEQRRTEWMPFDSLNEALDPRDDSLTLEGLPAPCRAVFIATRK